MFMRQAVFITTPWAVKNVPLYFCPYLCQLLTDFQNSFTGTLCGQFAIMWLLYIPPHCKCVSTLPCEILMLAKSNDDNKNLGKWKNASDQHCDECSRTMLYPHSLVHTDHSLQCWSELFFFQFYQDVCYHYVCILHYCLPIDQFVKTEPCQFSYDALYVPLSLISHLWWCGIAVTHFIWSTKLLYAGPG